MTYCKMRRSNHERGVSGKYMLEKWGQHQFAAKKAQIEWKVYSKTDVTGEVKT